MKFLTGKIWSGVYLQIDLKDATLTLEDGTTPTANSIEIKIGEGNLTWTETRNMDYTLDRGLLDEVREGDQAPMDISFDFVWEFLTGNTDTTANLPTIEDAFRQQGNAAGWVSSDSDVCRPFALNVIITHTPSCGEGDEEIITLPDFRFESLDHDLREGTVAVSGRSNATQASIVRQAIP